MSSVIHNHIYISQYNYVLIFFITSLLNNLVDFNEIFLNVINCIQLCVDLSQYLITLTNKRNMCNCIIKQVIKYICSHHDNSLLFLHEGSILKTLGLASLTVSFHTVFKFKSIIYTAMCQCCLLSDVTNTFLTNHFQST